MTFLLAINDVEGRQLTQCCQMSHLHIWNRSWHLDTRHFGTRSLFLWNKTHTFLVLFQPRFLSYTERSQRCRADGVINHSEMVQVQDLSKRWEIPSLFQNKNSLPLENNSLNSLHSWQLILKIILKQVLFETIWKNRSHKEQSAALWKISAK